MLEVGGVYKWLVPRNIYKENDKQPIRTYHILPARAVCLIIEYTPASSFRFEEYKILYNEQIYILPTVANKLSNFKKIC